MESRLRNRLDGAAYATVFIYAASVMALPVSLVKIAEELQFNLTQAGAFGFVTSWEQFFVLLASGFIAAKFGKIRSLRTALIITSAGMAIFTQSVSYAMAMSLVLVIGLGNGVLEALLTPLVEDVHPEDDGRKQNLLHAFWPIGVLVSTLAVGEILSRGVSWRWIYAGIAVLVFGINFLYPSSRRANLPRSRSDFSHMGEILSRPRFWVLGFALFFAGGAEGAFTFWTASYIQIQYDTLPRAGAYGVAAFALGMGTGRLLASRIAGKIGLKRLIQYSVVLAMIVGSAFFAVQGLPLLYVFMVVMGLTVACFWPSLQTYAVRVIGADATLIMIFMSAFGIPGFSSAAILMGIIGDARGLRASFIIVPIYLAVQLLLTFLEGRVERLRK